MTSTDKRFIEKLRISNPFLEIEWIQSYTHARKLIKKRKDSAFSDHIFCRALLSLSSSPSSDYRRRRRNLEESISNNWFILKLTLYIYIYIGLTVILYSDEKSFEKLKSFCCFLNWKWLKEKKESRRKYQQQLVLS